jgi:hypothetical protein
MPSSEDVERSAEAFKKDVAALLNRHNFDTYSNTPDFILAEYLTDCLLSYGSSVKNRDAHRCKQV